MFAQESDIKKRLIGGESAGVRNDPNGVNDLADKQFVDSKGDCGLWLQESSDDRGAHPHATILAACPAIRTTVMRNFADFAVNQVAAWRAVAVG